MFSCLKQIAQSILNVIKAPYINFTEAKRESTSKTFQSIAVAAFVGGVMRLFFDGNADNNLEVLLWLPCAILFFHLSILILPGEDEE